MTEEEGLLEKISDLQSRLEDGETPAGPIQRDLALVKLQLQRTIVEEGVGDPPAEILKFSELQPEERDELRTWLFGADSPPEVRLDRQIFLSGTLIDFASRAHDEDQLEKGVRWCGHLLELETSPIQKAQLRYYRANAHEHLRRMSREGWEVREWDQPELEPIIIDLRWALLIGTEHGMGDSRRCQILTNLGNHLSHLGRLLDAIQCYDRALSIDPAWDMARGNRGYAFWQYAQYMRGRLEALAFLQEAHRECSKATTGDLVPEAGKTFTWVQEQIENMLPSERLTESVDLSDSDLGATAEEKKYRQWTLRNRLFLDPLNDLGPLPSAGGDPLALPGIAVPIGKGPDLIGFFNQMKQEYVSGRFMLYQGLESPPSPHFADRDVKLANTMDYPAYSLTVEQVKVAYRVAYSLLDKIGFFLNDYLDLGIPEGQVNFRRIWYKGQDANQPIRNDVEDPRNIPLQGLFWLAKDLDERSTGDEYQEPMEPELRGIASVRNHLEHKYLKLHDSLWGGPEAKERDAEMGLADTLAHSMYRRDFEARTLRLYQLVRSALIHLVLAVRAEEARRQHERSEDEIVPPMFLDRLENDWKT